MVRVGMVDRWLAERVQRLVAPVAVRLELWDGTSPFSASDPPVGDWSCGTAGPCSVLPSTPTSGSARRMPPAAWPSGAPPSRSSRRCRGCRARRRHGAPASGRCWPRPIRSATPAAMSTTTTGQRLLSAVARSRPRLHLRLLRGPGDVARRGTARQARSRVPQAAATAWRHSSRSRVRLGSAGASHGAQLRRDGQGVQRVARAAWICTRTGRTRRAERSGRVHRRRLPQRAGRVRRVRVGRDAGARRPASLPQPRGRPAPHGAPPGWPRAAALHRARRPVPAQRVDTTAGIPRRVSADTGRGHLARARTGRHVGCRRREPSTALRAHAGTLERRLCGRGRPDPGHYGEAFFRTWELYLAGAQAAFATGWMQLFQIVFTPRESPPPSWTRAELLQPMEAVR